MSTQFIGEGNIGSPPEYREFPMATTILAVAPAERVLRQPVPTKGGEFEDRGGFWAPVELWHHDADRWQQLYQKGMRVLVVGRMERDPWTDNEDQPRETWQVNARSVGILPYRIESVASARSHRRQSRSPRPPRNRRRRKRPSAGSDRAWRAAAAVLRRPPCAANYPQGIAPPTSTEFHARSRKSRLSARTLPATHLPRTRHFIGVKAVAAACGLFAAARGCARHPRSQQLHEQQESGWTDMRLFLCEKPSRAKTLAGFSAPRSAVKAASTVPASRSPGASAISWRRRRRGLRRAAQTMVR
ncbi:single-stranded DNA-binding protein [Pseudomonas aeruginosa]|uniref:single-stranded DNA-binding protein n=1 Tax=Pseudomonas aeruginosa TaxID=287 RepID=UPI000AE55E10